jgi:hypothetical protein
VARRRRPGVEGDPAETPAATTQPAVDGEQDVAATGAHIEDAQSACGLSDQQPIELVENGGRTPPVTVQPGQVAQALADPGRRGVQAVDELRRANPLQRVSFQCTGNLGRRACQP